MEGGRAYLEYGTRGCSNVVIADYKTKTPILYLSEALFSSIDSEGEYKVSTGGEQGMSLLGWNTESSTQFVVQTPVFSMKFLEMAAGARREIKQDSVVNMETIEGDGTTEIELEYVPDASFIKVFKLNNSGGFIVSSLTVESVDEKVLTLNEAQSGWVLVLYKHDADIDQVNIGKFINSGFYCIYGKLEIYDQNQAVSDILYFEFPKVEIKYSFNLKMLNSNSPNQLFSIYCNALKEEDTLVKIRTVSEI